jgi:AcrR family transcriptional regulator
MSNESSAQNKKGIKDTASSASKMPSAARARILDTATRLFYRNGFHAVGIDTIIEQSSVAKMTFYRHFASKDDLVVAYLKQTNEHFCSWMRSLEGSDANPRAALERIFQGIAALAVLPMCLGCTFSAAAGEFPQTNHRVHRAALEHKVAVLERLSALARAAKLRAPDSVAEQLLLLMDGAWAAARMFGPQSHAGQVFAAANAILVAHERGNSNKGKARPSKEQKL